MDHGFHGYVKQPEGKCTLNDLKSYYNDLESSYSLRSEFRSTFFFGLNNENWRINFQLHWAVGNVGMETHQVLKAMDGQPL